MKQIYFISFPFMKNRTSQTFFFLMAFIAFDLPLNSQQVDYASLKYGEKLNGDSVVGKNSVWTPNIGVIFLNDGGTTGWATHKILYSGQKYIKLRGLNDDVRFEFGNIYLIEERLIKIYTVDLELLYEIDPSKHFEYSSLNEFIDESYYEVRIFILSNDYILLRSDAEYFIDINGKLILRRELTTAHSEVRIKPANEHIFAIIAESSGRDSAQIVVVDLKNRKFLADFTYKKYPISFTNSCYTAKTQRIYIGNSNEGKGLHVFTINGKLLYTIDDVSSWYSKYEPLEFADFVYAYDRSANTIIKLDINNGTILKKYPISSLFNQAELNNYHLYATSLINNKYYGIFTYQSYRNIRRFDFTILELNSELKVMDTIKVTNTSFSKIDFNKLLSQNQK
jgi:hypothetical protein